MNSTLGYNMQQLREYQTIETARKIRRIIGIPIVAVNSFCSCSCEETATTIYNNIQNNLQ